MEIKSNIVEMEEAFCKYEDFEVRLTTVREDLVTIITEVEDYWIGRSGDSFKYVCWYLKLLLDTGYDELDKLRNEIIEAKDAMYNKDKDLSHQIIMNA